VYGGNTKVPFSEADPVDTPISFYAATKRANELYAHVYHHLYGLNCTGLRFFTVYGPWGRPDMALFKFTKSIIDGEPIEVYNNGKMMRDFTYIGDAVQAVLAAIDKPFSYEIFNVGNNKPVELMKFIEIIEKELGKKAKKALLPLQPGDLPKTYADIGKARRMLGFEPKTTIEQGIKEFIGWYKGYYRIQ
jgi:UDP-glucuronate 4-epimerase